MAGVPHQPQNPLQTVVPATKVEVSLSCRNLLDMDVFSKSDPMAVMFVQATASTEYREYGRTETIWNTLNPDFVKKFTIDYFFEESQKLMFKVYDIDSQSADLSKHDFLGQVTCTLGEIVGAPGSKIEKPLTLPHLGFKERLFNIRSGPAKKCGTIILSAEELSSCKDAVTLQFRATKLDKKDFFGKSDPFLLFYRCNEDGSWTTCHKTEVIKNTLNPQWKHFTIPVRTFCNADYDRTIKVECYDWNRDGGHDLIGVFTTNLRQLTSGPAGSQTFDVIHPKKKAKKKKYKHSGTVTLQYAKVEQQYSFLDYVRGGTQMNFTVAIDFTASNGQPTQPTSLHYINPYGMNQYATALSAVGEIIQDYDSDKLFPAFGFGARTPPGYVVSHCFPLNGQPGNPYCFGVAGIMEAYQWTLRQVQLFGPTNFSPVINHVARLASQSREGGEYFVLLIVTDGVITDFEQTKEAIVNAATLPLSIIIVGVGNDDFEAMEILDGDEVRLSYRGRQAERDIVQFVPFRDYVDRQGNQVLSQARLAKDVLAEVPDQLLSYMKKHGIKPGAPPPAYMGPSGSSVPTAPSAPAGPGTTNIV
ncbi:copine-8-like isoform X2 [Branchiostoma lanceolatum]|uniref:copine-8-like isoform X2 n=1 Tax=Branchiostoma lanceolatum TaxID=7740 RepID=UPI003452CBF2